MAAGDTTKGTRVGNFAEVFDGTIGTYCPLFNHDGEVTALWFKLPSGSMGRISAVGHAAFPGGPEWTIRVEDDSTVTVGPSIEQHPVPGDPPTPYWHGFLERGVWREV